MDSLTPEPITIITPRTRDFPEAMRDVLEGKRIARVSWGNKDYGFLKDEWLTIFTNGDVHTWLVLQSDMEGQDWIVVNE